MDEKNIDMPKEAPSVSNFKEEVSSAVDTGSVVKEITNQEKDNVDKFEERKNEDEASLISLIFIFIIVIGGGYLIYSKFIINEDSNNNEFLTAEIVENDLDDQTELDDNIPNDRSLVYACRMSDDNGNYFEEIERSSIAEQSTIRDLYNESNYCSSNICMRFKNDVVEALNCLTGQTVETTFEEAKINAYLVGVCLDNNIVNKTIYNVACVDNMCSLDYEGNKYSQDCNLLN